MNISSQITFLYFNDYSAGCEFLESVLELEPVYDPGWAKVFRSVGNSYIGAVKANEGSIDGQKKGGVLVSLTVDDVTHCYNRFKTLKVTDLSEIKYFEDIGLRSFFFKEDIMGSGAIYASVTKKDKENVILLIPTSTLEQQFEAFAYDIDSQIVYLSKQNKKLAQARDILLPRLMNGTLTV